MGKKAIVSISSKQVNSKDEPVEIITQGQFYKKENYYYVVYEETELSGMKGTTTTLKIRPDKFSLIRMGTTSAKINFEDNNKDISMYNTPYGTLELVVETKKVDINVNDDGGNVVINYNMSLEGQEPLKTLLNVDIKTK